jgi:hypothetical protein
VIHLGLDEQDKRRNRDYEFHQHRVTVGKDPRCDVVVAMDEFLEILFHPILGAQIKVHNHGQVRTLDLTQEVELKLSGHRLRVSTDSSRLKESTFQTWRSVLILGVLHFLHGLFEVMLISTYESWLSIMAVTLLFLGGIGISTLGLGFVKKVISGQFQLLKWLEFNLFWSFITVVLISLLSLARVSTSVVWQYQEVESVLYILILLLVLYKTFHFLFDGRFEKLLRWGFSSLLFVYLVTKVTAYWPGDDRDYRLFRPDPAPPLVQIFQGEPQSLEEFLKSPLE